MNIICFSQRDQLFNYSSFTLHLLTRGATRGNTQAYLLVNMYRYTGWRCARGITLFPLPLPGGWTFLEYSTDRQEAAAEVWSGVVWTIRTQWLPEIFALQIYYPPPHLALLRVGKGAKIPRCCVREIFTWFSFFVDCFCWWISMEAYLWPMEWWEN